MRHSYTNLAGDKTHFEFMERGIKLKTYCLCNSNSKIHLYLIARKKEAYKFRFYVI